MSGPANQHPSLEPQLHHKPLSSHPIIKSCCFLWFLCLCTPQRWHPEISNIAILDRGFCVVGAHSGYFSIPELYLLNANNTSLLCYDKQDTGPYGGKISLVENQDLRFYFSLPIFKTQLTVLHTFCSNNCYGVYHFKTSSELCAYTCICLSITFRSFYRP